MPMRLFPATSRLLPGILCRVIEAVYELSASGCGFVDAALGIQGTRSKRPGTLRCLTDPCGRSPRQRPNFPTRCGCSDTQRTPFPERCVLRPGQDVSSLEPFASDSGTGERGPGRRMRRCCAGDGFVGTRSNLFRSPRRLPRRPGEVFAGPRVCVALEGCCVMPSGSDRSWRTPETSPSRSPDPGSNLVVGGRPAARTRVRSDFHRVRVAGLQICASRRPSNILDAASRRHYLL